MRSFDKKVAFVPKLKNAVFSKNFWFSSPVVIVRQKNLVRAKNSKIAKEKLSAPSPWGCACAIFDGSSLGLCKRGSLLELSTVAELWSRQLLGFLSL